MRIYFLTSIYGPHTARSRLPERRREGMEAPRPGTASPRKIFALARCTQHDKATYHLRVSSDGSSSKCAALRCASLRMSAAVSLAMKPCRSNASARESKGCSRRPVLRSNTGWSRFFRRAHSSATLPALFSQPRYVLGFARERTPSRYMSRSPGM